MTCLAKGGGPKKRFQYCLNPNFSKHFLYFRAIQGHSGGNLVDPALQDNVPLPKGFTEYIIHVGNANELNSVIRNGLIPGGKSLKRGRQAVFFTTVNPMDDGNGMGESPRDLTKPRIAPYKNKWKRVQNTVCWCNFEARSRERLAILPNAVTCSRSLQHTTCSLRWVKSHKSTPPWSWGFLWMTSSPWWKEIEKKWWKWQRRSWKSGGALPEGSLNSESATGCTQIELARSPRSTKPRRKIILGTVKRFEELRWNLRQHRGLQNFWCTSFCSRAAGYNTWEQGQEVDREVREPQA